MHHQNLAHVLLIHNMQIYIINISLNKINFDTLHDRLIEYGFVAETATSETPLLKIGRKGIAYDARRHDSKCLECNQKLACSSVDGKQVFPKVIWEEHVATPASENALSHCVC